MESDHHDNNDRIFSEIESIERDIEGVIEYHENINTIKNVTQKLLEEEGETKQLIYTGSESRRFISICYFSEEDEYDVLPLVFGESAAYYQLLVCRDDFPRNNLENNHTTIIFNCVLSSEHKDLMFSSQVVHIFANGSSQVFGKGWKIGGLETIQRGQLGPYVNNEEDFIQVVNASKRIKLSPDRFISQHWSPEQLDNADDPDMVESGKPNMDLHPLLDFFETEYRDYLQSN